MWYHAWRNSPSQYNLWCSDENDEHEPQVVGVMPNVVIDEDATEVMTVAVNGKNPEVLNVDHDEM